MDTARKILEEYVTSGKLMQVATLSGDGCPAVCNVWYRARFQPDRLYFISRQDREHSVNILSDERVAGGIVAIPLSGLGQTVRGVTFKGHARELGAEARTELEGFLERWPRAGDTITPDKVASGETPSRLYEIRVSEWVLFDEEMFRESPRQVIAAISDEK
jgi:hypothetical protein